VTKRTSKQHCISNIRERHRKEWSAS